MPFVQLTKPTVGKATLKTLIDSVIDNVAFIFNTLLGLASQDTLSNGSFEVDSDGDGIPDGWIETTSGGTIALDSIAANVAHGKKSIKFTSAGAGGGYITSEDYFACTDERSLSFSWQMKSTAAGVTNKVEISFYSYDPTGSGTYNFISTTTLYTNTTTNPTSYTLQRVSVLPPATSRFAKLKVTGADSATVGSTWYDDFQIVPTAVIAPNAIVAFTASGTFFVPSYVNRVKVRAWGGGAGGNAVGGGGGGYAEGVVSVTPGASVTVTIGAGGASTVNGGTTSFGTAVTASGGISSTGAGGTGGGTSLSISFTGGTGVNPLGGDCPQGGQGGKTAAGNGVEPGGGGGGNGSLSGTGAKGRVIIEY